jgi:tetratricopeptide (TPR) repeat protein
MAAVIGTDTRAAIAGHRQAVRGDRARRLQQLQAAEFVCETRLFPEHAYTFKHADHEVAYGGLLPERRQALHAGVEALKPRGDRRRPCRPPVPMPSGARSGQGHPLPAEQAGDKAKGRSAYREAVLALEQALVATQHLPEQRDRLAQALDLCVDLRSVLLMLGEHRRGFGYLRQAETLAESLGDQQQLGQVYLAMIHQCWSMGAYDDALAYSQRTFTLAAASGDVFEQAVAHGRLGRVYFSLGDYRRARDVFRQASASLEGDLLYRRFRTITESVGTLGWLVDCLRELGVCRGARMQREAARIADAASDVTARSRRNTSSVISSSSKGISAGHGRARTHLATAAPPTSALLARAHDILRFGMRYRAAHRGTAPARSGRGARGASRGWG